MKRILKILLIIIFIAILGYGGYFAYQKYMDYKEEQRIKNAIIKIDFINPLEVNFNSEIKLSDLITSINGILIDDFKIDTSVVGEKEISFKYINEEDIKIPYKFKLQVVDKVPPVIWLNDTYKVDVGYSKKLEDVIMCGDDYDDYPTCKIIGEYNLNKIGNYNLVYEATDYSGNKTSKEFTLMVTKKSKNTSSNSSIPFRSLYNEYKKNNTIIGIDVSKWQGDIDFDKVKDAGVEFVFIKLGGQSGIGKDRYIDSKFKRNIEGFQKVGIPVGLYYYSYADSIERAREDALWIIEQIKDEKIDLPIAYDWENWGSFNKFHMSFNTLTKGMEEFVNTLKKAGYEGMLYSSKNYLEKIWLKTNVPIWLAHYTTNTTYTGVYKCWQRTSSAKISGISGNTVDFDICYD